MAGVLIVLPPRLQSFGWGVMMAFIIKGLITTGLLVMAAVVGLEAL
jgi:hypothetical protein